MFLWERLGAASPGPISPYLAEFVTKKPAIKALQPQKKTTKHLGRRTAGKVDSGRELESVLLDVHSAVESVIGLKAEAEQPLMEAGLDSLGKIDVSHLSTVFTPPSQKLYHVREAWHMLKNRLV